MVEVVVSIALVGVVLWLLNTYVPMTPAIKTILNVVVVIALILWLLNVFGVWHGMPRWRQ